MTAYTDFHYSPTGSGVISGAQVLEQTEQGINGLGQYVQDNVSGAIDTANQALTTAQNADSNATAAINLANSFNAQIIAANQTAGNALTTAQSAQNTANSASSLATTANNNAATALNTANAASAGVTTLTGTVNSLGNRMTTAENAINANAGNITTLQNNLATTNANVTAAANAASSAQATATSAQSTATLARNQAYVLRYTGTTITGGGTIAYADIDNTDNIKAGDKIIDISGAIYAIASVDIANQTVTVGASPVINLFCDTENLIPAANNTYDLGSSSHQWNNVYASAFHGNAATASAFDTAKSITLKGAVTGTVSGTNSWEMVTALKTGSASTGGTVTNPYFKIASWEVAPNKYFGAILQIQNKCYPHNFATLIISVRTNVNAALQRGYSILNNASGVTPSDFILLYKEVTGKVLCELYYYTTTSYNGIRFSVISEGMGIQNANSLFNTMVVYQDLAGIAALPSDYTAIQTTIGTYSQDFIPYSTNTYDLGTSTNKWKTLNGVNPGALSLPDTTREEPIDTTNWVYTYTSANVYYPPEDGWLAVACSGSDYIQVDSNAGWGITLSKGYDGYCTGIIPVKKNVRTQIRIRQTSSGSVVVRKASFYPGTGDPSFTVTPLNNS